MKILHVCLANFYIDNYSYQENMLSKAHKDLGYDVEIIASLVSFDQNGRSCLLKKGGRYINEYGIPVTRLDYKNRFYAKRLRLYINFYETMEKAQPDIIFIHGCQFMDIKYVKKYVRKNSHVKVYVDNHADFSNSARGFLSKNILHKIVWKKCAKIIEPYTEKFYGVLPARVDFLKNIYKIPKEKIELLVMGADDLLVSKAVNKTVQEKVRKDFGISEKDFLVVTGGKIDLAKKQILNLMQAIKETDNPNIKLLIFGSIVPELEEQIKNLADDEKIKYIGWIDSQDAYKYFASADLVVFPGRHSVFWEQVVALKVPLMVKHWAGTTHVDIGGNVIFLYKNDIKEIKENISTLLNDKNKYNIMLEKARKKESENFLYSRIAAKSIAFEEEQK